MIRLALLSPLLVASASYSRAQPASRPASTLPARSTLQELVGHDPVLCEAEAHYARGKVRFKDSDFIAAAVEFRQARELFARWRASAVEPLKADKIEAYERTALSNEASAYSRAKMPVEALAAFKLLLSRFGEALAAERVAQIKQAIATLGDRIGRIRFSGLSGDKRELVRVDGRLISADKRAAPLPLAAGRHGLEVEAPGFLPLIRSFTVAPRRTVLVEVRLEPSKQPGRVRIEVDVQQAEASVDGKVVGTAPVERTVSPGAHKYKVTSESYLEHSGTFKVDPGERALISVGMKPRYSPLGLIIIASYVFSVNLRGETPFNSWMDEDDDFSEGTGLAMGASLKFVYQIARLWNLRAGVGFEYAARPLNRVMFGLNVDWCPDAVEPWCPLNGSAYYVVVPGQVRQFSGGEHSLRAGTRLERRIGRILFSFGAGFGAESYKRSALVGLSLGTFYAEAGVGMDL